MHHYLIEAKSKDTRYLFELKTKLLNKGCKEKYSEDLELYRITIFSCKDVVVQIGFKDFYYIDIVSVGGKAKEYVRLVCSVFPKSKIAIHYVIRVI